jgi:prepilin-type N-terminal cleavage/methylation domain-containing protein
MIFDSRQSATGVRQRGFSVIELLITLVIIAVGVAALVSLQRTLLQSSSRTAARITALNLLQQQLAELRCAGVAAVTDGAQTQQRDGSEYRLSWQITASAAPLPAWAEAKLIDISVQWGERGGAEQSVTRQSWLATAANLTQY